MLQILLEPFGIQIAAWLTILSLVAIWLPNKRVWQVSCGVTILAALLTGSLSPIALVPILGLLGLSYLHLNVEQAQSFFLLTLIASCLAFGLHVLPGFHNQEYLAAYQLNHNSAPFSIWFNYDKSMAALILLGTLFHKELLRSTEQWFEFFKTILPIIAIGLPSIYTIGLLLGYAHFDWSPSPTFWPWALKNLFFTVIAEEILFRGLIQRELSKRLKGKSSNFIAIGLAALLFGLAHYAGGTQYIILSTIAGLVYGYAYYKTGRIEGAILAHFLLNAIHFIFFSYPFYLPAN